MSLFGTKSISTLVVNSKARSWFPLTTHPGVAMQFLNPALSVTTTTYLDNGKKPSSFNPLWTLDILNVLGFLAPLSLQQLIPVKYPILTINPDITSLAV